MTIFGMPIKDFVEVVSAAGAAAAFVLGVLQYVHSNAIRRYEKFHEMSVRFDENDDIQAVCEILNGVKPGEAANRQQKEVFICFLEEIYFMMHRPRWKLYPSIMNRNLALYSFGYYGHLALYGDHKEQFWKDLKKDNPFYAHFLAFCNLAESYRQARSTTENLAY